MDPLRQDFYTCYNYSIYPNMKLCGEEVPDGYSKGIRDLLKVERGYVSGSSLYISVISAMYSCHESECLLRPARGFPQLTDVVPKLDQ